MPHADVTLDAQAEIITHWIIRSLLGETLDMRAVSSDYSVARAQHYMEQHYMEPITISKLAALGYVSASAFQHKIQTGNRRDPNCLSHLHSACPCKNAAATQTDSCHRDRNALRIQQQFSFFHLFSAKFWNFSNCIP